MGNEFPQQWYKIIRWVKPVILFWFIINLYNGTTPTHSFAYLGSEVDLFTCLSVCMCVLMWWEREEIRGEKGYYYGKEQGAIREWMKEALWSFDNNMLYWKIPQFSVLVIIQQIGARVSHECIRLDWNCSQSLMLFETWNIIMARRCARLPLAWLAMLNWGCATPGWASIIDIIRYFKYLSRIKNHAKKKHSNLKNYFFFLTNYSHSTNE